MPPTKHVWTHAIKKPFRQERTRRRICRRRRRRTLSKSNMRVQSTLLIMLICESVFLSFKHALHHSKHRMGAAFIFQLILSTGMLQKLDVRKSVAIWLWLNVPRNNRKSKTSLVATVRVYISWYILHYFTPITNKTLMFSDIFRTLYFSGIWVVYIQGILIIT